MTTLIIGSSIDQRLKKIKALLKNFPAVDILWSEEEGVGIENVRGWISWLALTGSGRKTLVIQSASELTTEAQNALLKTLEEPPAEAQIILEAPSENGLLTTVLSRATLVDLGQDSFSPHDKIRAQLQTLNQANLPTKFNLALALAKDKDKLEDWLNDAIYLLHQELITGERVEEKIVGLLIAKTQLKTNCNARLVLENAFINW